MSTDTQTLDAPAALPAQKGGVAPYLTLDGARKAADFYVKALAAEIAVIMPPDDKGRYIHIHLYINGGSVMLSDAFEDHGHAWTPPAGFSLTLSVDDADAWADRAAKAGAEVIMPVQDMFWGDRYGQVRDPFGVIWAFNQPRT
jgi:PhnB protein